jgi:hypothetical protein
MVGSVPRAIYDLANTIAKHNTTHSWAHAKNLIDDLSEKIITMQKIFYKYVGNVTTFILGCYKNNKKINNRSIYY